MNQRKSKSEDCWQLMHKIMFVLQNACVIPRGLNLHRITFAQLRVLDIVCRHHPEGLMLKDITSELNQTAATTSAVVLRSVMTPGGVGTRISGCILK